MSMMCNANDWGDLTCTLIEGHAGPCDYNQAIYFSKMERGDSSGWILHEVCVCSGHRGRLLRHRLWWTDPGGAVHEAVSRPRVSAG